MKPYYRCPECKQTTTRKWNMLEHIRTQHPTSKNKPKQEYELPSKCREYCPYCGAKL